MTTITASTTIGLVLNTASYTNPVVIDAGVTISNSVGSDAVSVSGPAYFFAIQNDGVISGASSTAGIGAYLDGGGSVTNAASASIAGGGAGIEISGGTGTVVNNGSIAGTGANGHGVILSSGGSVSNATSASIMGYRSVDIGASGGVGTVVNYGSIVGTGIHGVAVRLRSGGSVTNAISASIMGSANGVHVSGGAGTMVNDAAIAGNLGFGVDLDGGGSVTNAASASIMGGTFGVELSAGGTLTNAGSIVGSGGTAVAFGGTGSNLLVLDPGFGFTGLVTGSTSASNTLELASAASVGTVTGLGTQFTNFGPIQFDTGAQWSIAGNTSGLAGTISGFALGDTIELDGVTSAGSSYVGGILTIDDTAGSATLDLPGTFTTTSFDITNNSDGVAVTVAPCFCAGTRIECVDGEQAVETLVPGEFVRVASADCAKIRWIGHRHVDCSRHRQPQGVWPVRVRTGAFGANVPHRDLLLSPDHAVFIDGVLIPIRYLINGSTIVQEQVDEVTYYHVEIGAHGVILAEGLACESYLDTGNRAAFADDEAKTVAPIHPSPLGSSLALPS